MNEREINDLTHFIISLSGAEKERNEHQAPASLIVWCMQTEPRRDNGNKRLVVADMIARGPISEHNKMYSTSFKLISSL